MAFESIQRLLSPAAIHYQQAIGVAHSGLLVNLACAWLLKDGTTITKAMSTTTIITMDTTMRMAT
jgi:Co/Zn/Cd efflux system component